jgi:hypothetical protein
MFEEAQRLVDAYRAAHGIPAGADIPQAVMDDIWKHTDAIAVRRATLSGHAVMSFGVPSRYQLDELRVLSRWGTAMGGLSIVGGALTLMGTAGSDDLFVRVVGSMTGVVDITGGILYGGGAFLANGLEAGVASSMWGGAQPMAWGTGLLRVGAGGAGVLDSYGAYRRVQGGDHAGAAADSVSAVGNFMLAAGSIWGLVPLAGALSAKATYWVAESFGGEVPPVSSYGELGEAVTRDAQDVMPSPSGWGMLPWSFP